MIPTTSPVNIEQQQTPHGPVNIYTSAYLREYLATDVCKFEHTPDCDQGCKI